MCSGIKTNPLTHVMGLTVIKGQTFINHNGYLHSLNFIKLNGKMYRIADDMFVR